MVVNDYCCYCVNGFCLFFNVLEVVMVNEYFVFVEWDFSEVLGQLVVNYQECDYCE